jgi:hypothetical protein
VDYQRGEHRVHLIVYHLVYPHRQSIAASPRKKGYSLYRSGSE